MVFLHIYAHMIKYK